MNKKLLTTSVFLATSIAMAFEPWIGFDTPTPYYVNTGLDNGTNTAGYWFVKTDEGDGGKSKVVWPVPAGNEYNPDAIDPIIDFCKGVCGTADLDKGTLTYTPFITLGFNVAGEDANSGKLASGDASEWGGICITYRSDIALYPELSLGDAIDAEIRYALPTRSIPQAKNGTKKCIPWSEFKQPSWYKGATKISGPDAAAQLVSINFKMQNSSGQYKFNICAIGPYGDGTGKGLPETCSVPLTHPAISVNAKWSKGDDGYDATITVKDGEKELTLGTDYEIESNVNDATGIVIKTITGKGDYTGSVVKSLVPYIDENGEPQVMYDATVLTSDVTDYIENGVINLPGGWYVVQGEVKYMSQVKFEDDAHLILADGAKLEIESEDFGIYANENLTIYGQNEQRGILNDTAKGTNGYGIYGKKGVTISGGKVTATGGNSGISADGGITINDGVVEVTGTSNGIKTPSNVTVNGGSITVSGGSNGIIALSNVTVNGGLITVSGGSNGIKALSNVTVNGGSITATGGYHGIRAENDIVLGWSDAENDHITASSFLTDGSVSIAKDKSFKDENGKEYSGTIDDVSDIAGKTLVPPSFEGKFLSDVNVAVADIPVQKYVSGKPVCPSVLVTDGKDTLNAGTDYMVVCSNNNAVTSATLDEAAIAQITGKGNYAGAIQKRFFIWENIGNYAAVQVYKDKKGDSHAEIDGAYDGTDAVAIDEDVENVAVKFNRKFLKDTYSTIVLPFSVNTANIDGLNAVLYYNGIGTDANNNDAIKMKVLWAKDGIIKDDKGNSLSYDHTNMEANTPYLVLMNSETFAVEGPVTIVPTAKAVTKYPEWDWEFRGVWEYKVWGAQGVDKEVGYAYGFAASSPKDSKIKVGDFVKIGEGTHINPLRAYLVSSNIPEAQGVRANGAYVKRPAVTQKELPEFMSVIIDGLGDNGNGTTVIGQFNTRTGEFKMNYDRGKFDLKGRNVGNKANNARGAYYGKKTTARHPER